MRYKMFWGTLQRSQGRDLCSVLKMTEPSLNITSHTTIQPVFLFISILFPQSNLIKVLEKLVEGMEKVEYAYLESVLVVSFGI